MKTQVAVVVLNKPNWKLAVGIPLAIFFSSFLITLSAKYKLNSDLLSKAIIIDLLIIAPLIYFIVIRKSTVSKLTVLRVFIAGLLVAGWILNNHSNTLLHVIKIWISPIIECALLFSVGRKFYIANRKAKEIEKNKLDFLIYCRTILFHFTGNEKTGNIISSEIAVFYYAFIGRKNKHVDYKSTFTSYKENGILLILGVFLSLFLMETITMHFVFNLWNKTFAWVLTGLSFYTCIQLYAHIKAIKARPINLNDDSLEIHNGLAGDAFIKYNNIEKIEPTNKIPVNRDTMRIALLKGLENHNCVIYLKEPIYATKIFGIKKRTDTVLFYVDNLKDFSNALNFKLQNNS